MLSDRFSSSKIDHLNIFKIPKILQYQIMYHNMIGHQTLAVGAAEICRELLAAVVLPHVAHHEMHFPRQGIMRFGGLQCSLACNMCLWNSTVLLAYNILYCTIVCFVYLSQNLTTLRLVSHISTGVIIGILYWNVGNNGRLIRANSSFLFFSAILMMFAAMMPLFI